MTQLHISISTIANGVLVHVGSPYAETSVLAYGSKGQEPTHYPTMDGALAALPQLAADALVEQEDRRKAEEQEKLQGQHRYDRLYRQPTCGENDVMLRDRETMSTRAFRDTSLTETNTFNAEAHAASLPSDLSEPKGPFPPEEPYPGEDDGA